MRQIVNKKILIFVSFAAAVLLFVSPNVTRAAVPAGCIDVDGNDSIDVRDCGAPGNDQCSACFSGGNGIVGDTCDSDSDCAQPLFCLGGPGGACAECSINGQQCSSGEICNNLVCVQQGGNDAGDLCLRDGHCSSGKCGQDGTCAAGLPIDDGGGVVGPTGASGSWTGIDLTIQDVFTIINGLTCWFARIASILMVIFIIIAGLRFMIARGDTKAYDTAKKNFGHVLIGLLVILGVYVIIATVANAVGVKDFSFIPLVC